MITNPKDFFQQIQNFVEEVALKIKAINGSISTFLTKSDAEATYLAKTEASNTYLGKSEPASRATVADSATSADKATKDANGDNIANTYLKATVAASTYLGKTAKAESAKTADSATTAGSATKATQDGNGKNIANTYATIASLTTTNTNVTNAQTTANDAKTLAEGALPLSGGNVTGNLTVQSKNVVRSVNGTFAGANGDVTLTVGGSSAYQIPFGTCSTSSTVSEKVATITNGATFSLEPGSIVAIKFSNEPSKFTSLNVNSSGAKGIKEHSLWGEADDTMLDISLSFTHTNDVFVFVFDGTYWNFVTAHGIGEIVGIT